MREIEDALERDRRGENSIATPSGGHYQSGTALSAHDPPEFELDERQNLSIAMPGGQAAGDLAGMSSSPVTTQSADGPVLQEADGAAGAADNRQSALSDSTAPSSALSPSSPSRKGGSGTRERKKRSAPGARGLPAGEAGKMGSPRRAAPRRRASDPAKAVACDPAMEL